jgi:signal transduction histidine kinase
MWQLLLAWLKRLPIGDPVDRRNAFFMQLLMIYEGCETPLNKAYLFTFDPVYALMLAGREKLPPQWPRYALAIDVGTDLIITLAAWISFYLIRRGLFRQAVSQFLAALLISSLIAYATFGYEQWQHDIQPVVELAIAGLMLGRRALWTIYAIVTATFTAGITTDYLRHHHTVFPLMNTYSVLPSLMLQYLLMAIILDRSTSALRQSLAESNTQRQQLQHEMTERERTQEQLLHAQKMDAVGRLTSGIAHDFNNVLGIILGFGMERHRLDEPGAVRDRDSLALAHALEGVEMAARRGASISGKLLNFSRRDVTHIEIFDAAATLRELSPLLRQLLPPSVQLHLDMPSKPLSIRFDRSQFELAVLNFASNARDAMPDGGDFTISAGVEDGDSVVISLHDTGEGIPEAIRQHIFEPFFTTKPIGSGTGLGLSVVYGLIDRAGGRIHVASTPGRGTTFRIELPAADNVIEHALPASSRDEVRVLLIDDDDDLRDMLTAALEHGGCKVTGAATGAEAERHMERGGQPPQVLVCDNRMPDIDGITLLRRLRRHLPEVPVILISAYLDMDGQTPPVDGDGIFTERLPKPFAPSLLVARVLHAAGKSRSAA